MTNSPWGYTGESHDIEAGLVYLRARYYEPGTGRFIQQDSYPYFGEIEEPLTRNLYIYGNGNPLKYTDPSGNSGINEKEFRKKMRSLVMEYYRYKNELERYYKLSSWEKILIGPPRMPLLMNEDSSTGIGQIFARTAIDAYNASIERGDLSGKHIDYDDWHEREKIWYALRDDKTNIFYIALVLKHKAEKLGIDLNSATDEEIEITISRYNETNKAAAEYGRETKQYYDLFKKLIY
ncbi:MAG: hypothetical protein K0S61_4911 [Anaerocolumna sp.]|nr:hypothetical protein [Anaerocolumna sp.]